MGSFKCDYIPYVKEFTKSEEFSFLANYFESNKINNKRNSTYTNFIPGTAQYENFWKQVEDWCINGYTNSAGITITGQHFFYLNFCRILSESEDKGIKRKKENFPKFVDLDYDFFWLVDYCRKNQKSLIAVKGRRQGWSYKAGGIAAHEFSFYRDSKSLIGGFLSKYSETTMKFALNNLNWLNENTEFGKQRNPDLKDFVKARYQADIGDGVKVWKGYMSEIMAITFQNNPTAAVGQSATWLIFDEGGVFNNIKETYGYTEPLIKDGSNYTGSALIFGSAGDMDSGSRYFYEMFTSPNLYNMLEFDDPDNPDKKIGFFSSSLRGRWGICRNPDSKYYKQLMVDSNGNSNEQAAYDDLMWERENKKKTTSDTVSILLQITQFPVTWKEAFTRSKGTVFASTELAEHLAALETDKTLSGQKKYIELYFNNDNILCSKLAPDSSEMMDFPVPRNYDKDKSGTIVIYEEPERINNEIPNFVYVAGQDPYDQDDAETSTSLGSMFIYKRFYQADKTYNIIVAEYTGRPDKADVFYENCRKLLIYYNAKCLYENQLKGFKAYMQNKNSLHLLYEQPQIIRDIVKDSKVNRGYGIHMTKEIKFQCEIYLKQWLYEEKVEVSGKKILNLHSIKSIPLLRELIAYDRDINTDRVIAFMLCILQTKEIYNIQSQSIVEESSSVQFLKRIWDRSVIKKKNVFNF